MGLKVTRIPILGISGFPLGSLGTKWHLGAGPVARHKIYYKGENGAFPQIWGVVSLVSPCLLVAYPCSKVLQLRTNQLVVWFVQVRVSNWIACQSSWSHLGALARPFTPEVWQAKERVPIPSPSIAFTFRLVVGSIKELGGASRVIIIQN
jgi:hypothetical protein